VIAKLLKNIQLLCHVRNEFPVEVKPLIVDILEMRDHFEAQGKLLPIVFVTCVDGGLLPDHKLKEKFVFFFIEFI
jgi:hypothetical protein